MKRILLLAFMLIIYKANAQHQLVKIWETDTVWKVPESVLPDKTGKFLYVSNIDGGSAAKDGKGSIGKLGLDGTVIAVDWVSGLNAPKGMGIWKDKLYVADVDEVVMIDVKKGSIEKKIPIANATFLNDLAIGPNGEVYVSDTRAKKIFVLKNETPSLFIDSLQSPNGVMVKNGELYFLDAGSLYKYVPQQKPIKIAEGMEASTDGLEALGDDFIVSCWVGTVYYVFKDGHKEKLLDTRDQKSNTADIGFNATKKIVYVPTFAKNKIVAYQLK
jgi:DNA-binding beta-propeller fold protein YncE